MSGFDPFSQVLVWGATLAMTALFLLPARVIQKRHSYPAWLLIFGLIPYFGFFVLMWAFATTEPRKQPEAEQ